MRKEPKRSPTESPLLFEVDPELLPEMLTGLGGIPLVVQAFRSLGLAGSVREQRAQSLPPLETLRLSVG
jgi:hypothetical protein